LKQLSKSHEGYAVIDSIYDNDLKLIGKAARDLKLITGGSGVALELPNNFKREAIDRGCPQMGPTLLKEG
jgi:uncharacterized protein YgbK (DUF1537 family)